MNWKRLATRLLLADDRISPEETEIVKDEVFAAGQPSSHEVLEFLQELRREGAIKSADFDRFFFAQIKRVVLDDGKISDIEARWLWQVLLEDDGVISPAEAAFLIELKLEAKAYSPAFEILLARTRGA